MSNEIVQVDNIDSQLIAPFEPSEDQQAFLKAALSPKTGMSMEEWLKASNTAPQALTFWKKNPGFLPWFVSEFERNLEFAKLEWLKTGIIKMKQDPKTWIEMGRLILYPDGIPRSPVGKGSKRTVLEKTVTRMIEQATETE